MQFFSQQSIISPNPLKIEKLVENTSRIGSALKLPWKTNTHHTKHPHTSFQNVPAIFFFFNNGKNFNGTSALNPQNRIFRNTCQVPLSWKLRKTANDLGDRTKRLFPSSPASWTPPPPPLPSTSSLSAFDFYLSGIRQPEKKVKVSDDEAPICFLLQFSLSREPTKMGRKKRWRMRGGDFSRRWQTAGVRSKHPVEISAKAVKNRSEG